MKLNLYVLLGAIPFLNILSSNKIYCQFVNSQEVIKTDTLVETYNLQSKIFKNERTIRVLLPPGYYDSVSRDTRYPVLYLNDGFSVFKNWKLKQTVYSLIMEDKINPIIVVGIDNAINNQDTSPDYRTDEYLPYPEEAEPTVPHPHGKLYPDFITKEVLPVINSKYRTLAGMENTAIGGSSYGGVIALYMYIQKPGIFGKLILESTPFFISNERLIDEARKFKKWRGDIFIGIGTNETSDEKIIKKAQDAQDKFLEILNQHTSVKVKLTVTEGGRHNSSTWAERLPLALQFLFAK